MEAMNTTIPTPAGAVEGMLRDIPGNKKLLVIAHGFKSSHEHPAIKAITTGLHKNGHAVFSFNFSPDKTGMNIPQQMADINAVIEHFKTREIFLLGGSFGALLSAMAAQSNPRVAGLVTLNGFFGGRQLGKRTRWIFLGLRTLTLVEPRYRAMWRYFKQTFRPAKVTCPALIIHSHGDKNVLMSQSLAFYDALSGRKEFVALAEADHDLTDSEEITTVIGAIDGWVRGV